MTQTQNDATHNDTNKPSPPQTQSKIKTYQKEKVAFTVSLRKMTLEKQANHKHNYKRRISLSNLQKKVKKL